MGAQGAGPEWPRRSRVGVRLFLDRNELVVKLKLGEYILIAAYKVPSMSDKPKAFVIMPFDAELNEVYGSFIVPTLEEIGYSVLRADDLYGQRNILRDIVESISDSDLIVADLTGLNPNVFYELGVAHGLQRSVILMTQNIDEL